MVNNAIASGDSRKRTEAKAKGEILELKKAGNGMVGRLRALAVEGTQVTLGVGRMEKLSVERM
ncbi:hypothetical protein DL96DRAFT_874664 [Flagelloscypha sp. PMI_526]|nr:hypothetical protein DL96DRAFT_874664 [Flagelloscypha sp. PMI_526]